MLVALRQARPRVWKALTAQELSTDLNALGNAFGVAAMKSILKAFGVFMGQDAAMQKGLEHARISDQFDAGLTKTDLRAIT